LVRNYPEHAAELTEMAIELALDALNDNEDNGDNSSAAAAEASEAVSTAMSRFQNRLYQVRTAERASQTKAAVGPRNPFALLDRAQLRALGQRLKANTVFILKLRDRLIEAETMTEGFKRYVANELKAPFDIVAAHFSGHAEVAAQASYKADQKPKAGKKQPFEEAVRTSGLSPEQQAYLRSL
jgi:hypothetical protein